MRIVLHAYSKCYNKNRCISSRAMAQYIYYTELQILETLEFFSHDHEDIFEKIN